MIDGKKGGMPTSYESAKTMMGEDNDFDGGLDVLNKTEAMGLSDFDRAQEQIAAENAERAAQEALRGEQSETQIEDDAAAAALKTELKATLMEPTRMDVQEARTVMIDRQPKPATVAKPAAPKTFWQNLASAPRDAWKMFTGR